LQERVVDRDLKFLAYAKRRKATKIEHNSFGDRD